MSKFFSIDRASFVDACNLGINPASAYLTIASGTGKKNDTSRWSAKAVADYMAMRWGSANLAIGELLKAGLLTNSGTKERPVYVILSAAQRGRQTEEEAQRIWLPNSVVTSAAEEVAPLVKLRQTQDVMTLRLFIELYLAQNLLDDGGVSMEVYCQKYDRTRVGSWRQYTVYRFEPSSGWVTWGSVAGPHRREKLTEEEKDAGKNAGIDFFSRLRRLQQLGLVEEIIHLYDGPKGEPVMEFDGRLRASATAAAEAMLTEGQLEFAQLKGGELFPVLSHMEHATLYGVLRMRYRPQTKMTAAWFAKREAASHEVKEIFDAHLEELRPTLPKQANSRGFV